MAPLETWRAKRRWTLAGKKAQLTENSDSSYGEEILPTIDTNALKQLPRDEQQKFLEMHSKDRKNVLGRWKKEGRSIPTKETVTVAKSTTSLAARRSPPPNLPELKMDVSKDSLSTAFQPHKLFGSGTTSDRTDVARHHVDAVVGQNGQNKTWNQYHQPGEATTPPHHQKSKATQRSSPHHHKPSLGLDAMDEAGPARRSRRRGFYGAAEGMNLVGSETGMDSPPNEAASDSVCHTDAEKGQSSTSGASQRTPITGDTRFAKPGPANAGPSANTQAPGRYAARVAQKLASGKGWMKGQLKGKKGMDAVPSEPVGGSRSHGEVEVGVARKVSVTRVSKPQPVDLPLPIYTGGPGSAPTRRARMEGYE
ncbi:MAG: hypothetical protein L6R37_005199 [Teloschistes peruensis]|nr:MAG: hypothetical protein L6R37_005199 [Teloschistes peruensis]